MKRMTRQRQAITHAMADDEHFHSAQEIHEKLAKGGDSIGLATVYRNLQAMAESGIVDVIRLADSETAMYRLCDNRSHHHHLVCRRCGRTVELTTSVVERWASGIAHDNGFTDAHHSLEIFGLCAQCSKELAL